MFLCNPCTPSKNIISITLSETDVAQKAVNGKMSKMGLKISGLNYAKSTFVANNYPEDKFAF